MISIETLIQQVESLLRGGTVDCNQIKDISKSVLEMLEFFSSASSCDVIVESEKNEKISLAVKLHNKARNLSSNSYNELRTYLRATAAWMLCKYGSDKAKALSIVITLLSRTGHELTVLGKEKLALRCLRSAQEKWQKSQSTIFGAELSPVELQDIKTAVFWANIKLAELYANGGVNLNEIRTTIGNAMELCQTLPSELKYVFSERVLDIGKKLTNHTSHLQDSIHLHKIALNALESNILPGREFGEETQGDGIKTNTKDRQTLIVDAQLSLAYLFSQNNEIEKALSCIKSIEESTQSAAQDQWINHTVSYAKFIIYAKDKDWSAAEDELWRVIKSERTPFDMAMSAVQVLDNSDYNCKIEPTKFYNYLSQKFCSEPHYSKIRIRHLQSIFANIHGRDESLVDIEASELSNSIVTDCKKEEHKLNEKLLEHLKKIFTDRICWYRNQHQDEKALNWCNILEALIETEPDEFENVIKLDVVKIDSLLNLGRIEEAVKLSEGTAAKVLNTRTALIYFKTKLHHQDCNKAVKSITTLLQTKVARTADNESNNDCELGSNHIEYLRRLILSSIIAQTSIQIDKKKRNETVQLLLKEWAQHYVQFTVWEYSAAFKEDFQDFIIEKHEDIANYTFFSVICEYCSIFSYQTMICSPQNVKSISTDSALSEIKNLDCEQDLQEEQCQVPHEACSPTLDATRQQDDTFIFRGYPDAISASRRDFNTLLFDCDIVDLYQKVVLVLELTLEAITRATQRGYALTTLGKISDLEWLSVLASNLGAAILHGAQIENSNRAEPENDTTENSLLKKAQRLAIGAKFLELAEDFHDKLWQSNENAEEEGNREKSIKRLLSACAARIQSCSYSQQYGVGRSSLTVQSFADTSNVGHDSNSGFNELTHIATNLSAALKDVRRANTMIFTNANLNPNMEKIINVATILEFYGLCKSKDIVECKRFLDAHQNDILQLSATDLQKCANMASEEKLPIDIVQRLLNYALQISIRDAIPNYSNIGTIYRRLITLSPTRQQALEKIEQFEQLVRSAAESNDQSNSQNQNFLVEDIDSILSLSYNFGITLIDLDQLSLAERFISKAIGLSDYASEVIKGWLPKMQVIVRFDMRFSLKITTIIHSECAASLHLLKDSYSKLLQLKMHASADSGIGYFAEIQAINKEENSSNSKKRNASIAGIAHSEDHPSYMTKDLVINVEKFKN